jgi:hypothetical protein
MSNTLATHEQHSEAGLLSYATHEQHMSNTLATPEQHSEAGLLSDAKQLSGWVLLQALGFRLRMLVVDVAPEGLYACFVGGVSIPKAVRRCLSQMVKC